MVLKNPYFGSQNVHAYKATMPSLPPLHLVLLCALLPVPSISFCGHTDMEECYFRMYSPASGTVLRRVLRALKGATGKGTDVTRACVYFVGVVRVRA